MVSRKKTRQSKSARLDLLIDPALKNFIRDYAVDKHTTITEIVTRHFVELRDRERGSGVEQI